MITAAVHGCHPAHQLPLFPEGWARESQQQPERSVFRQKGLQNQRLETRGREQTPAWRTRELKLMFQHLQNLLYFCLKKLNILITISEGVSESYKLVLCLCAKGPQINCTQFPEADHCLRNSLGQAKSTRYFQDFVVMRWEDEFLEILCSEHPVTHKKFVSKQKREQKESEFIQRWGCKFRIHSVSPGTSTGVSRDPW